MKNRFTLKKSVLTGAALCVALAVILTGCSTANQSESSGVGGTLTVASTTAPNSLDPAQSANGAPSRWFIDPAYATLLTLNPTTGAPEAGLADKWGYVGSGNDTFEFQLRKNLKFADGTALRAKDVVASFKYYLSTGAGPTKAFFAGWTYEAVNDLTVRITTPAPVPIIPELLTPDFLIGDIISPAGLVKPSVLAAGSYGAGAYVLDQSQTVAGDHYTYIPNKNYYDAANVHYKKIVAKVIPNLTQQVQALKTGQIQVMLSDPTVASTLTGGSIATKTRLVQWTGMYLFDRDGTIVPALKSLKVRQALNYAIDRNPIVQAVYGKYGQPTSQEALPGSSANGYDPALDKAYGYDLAKAKSLLAEAGYANGFSMPVFYESYVPSEAKLAQVLASQLSKIGVTLELKGESNFSSWVSDLFSKKFAGTVFNGGGGQEAYTSVQWFLTNGALNPFKTTTPTVETAYQTLSAAKAGSSEETAAARQVMKALVNSADAVVVARTESVYAYDKSKVSGVRYIGATGTLTTITDWVSK